ncbi:MAG: G1 family glutamic endopeptidase, partial [Chloroflexota bacterium]
MKTPKAWLAIPLLVMALSLAACAPSQTVPRLPDPFGSSTDPGTSVLKPGLPESSPAPTQPRASAAPSSGASVQPSPSGSVPTASSAPAAGATLNAIKAVIRKANQEQAKAFAAHNAAFMKDTSTAAYYQQVVQTNQDLAGQGVSSIQLIQLDWGSVSLLDSNTAQATTFETWRTSYTDGSGDQSRDRNIYQLVQRNGSWKISEDAHPDSGLNQPGGQGASPSPGPGQTTPPGVGRPFARGGVSHNWSGYASANGTFTAVSGTWVVPQPKASGKFGVDAAWVGIGGLRSRDLIQAGTQETVLSAGHFGYEAWIEMLPQVSRPIPVHIKPGDSVTVSIAQQPSGRWLVTFKDNTTGQTWRQQEVYRSSLSSAEWIEEAPSGRRGVLPLSNFGTLTFTNGSAVENG